jgi:hypothetical protein
MWDGCGPCSYCCTVINMEYDNAVCPVCNHRMSSHEAQSICSSYPGSLPLNVLSERECEGYVPSPIVEAMAKGSVPPLSEDVQIVVVVLAIAKEVKELVQQFNEFERLVTKDIQT